jgi:L-threonylcarbamoyladenylate synthase
MNNNTDQLEARRAARREVVAEAAARLGADATDDRPVAAIFEAKGRPRFNPLIMHVLDLEQARRHGVFNRLALKLAEAFMPGALTLVVPRLPDSAISLLATAGLDTVALRAPAHPMARALLKAAGVPVAAPSANKSGRVSPTTGAHVAEQLGDDVALIIDAGRCRIGLESTIVSCIGDDPVLLRPGGISREDIEAAIGRRLRELQVSETPSAPGQLASHYAPNAALRLGATNVVSGEALLAFGPNVPDHDGPMLNLSPAGELPEAAANLFAHLRALDEADCECIAVMPVPELGLGDAINDRLRRAAAPRE